MHHPLVPVHVWLRVTCAAAGMPVALCVNGMCAGAWLWDWGGAMFGPVSTVRTTASCCELARCVEAVSVLVGCLSRACCPACAP